MKARGDALRHPEPLVPYSTPQDESPPKVGPAHPHHLEVWAVPLLKDPFQRPLRIIIQKTAKQFTDRKIKTASHSDISNQRYTLQGLRAAVRNLHTVLGKPTSQDAVLGLHFQASVGLLVLGNCTVGVVTVVAPRGILAKNSAETIIRTFHSEKVGLRPDSWSSTVPESDLFKFDSRSKMDIIDILYFRASFQLKLSSEVMWWQAFLLGVGSGLERQILLTIRCDGSSYFRCTAHSAASCARSWSILFSND